MSEEILVKVDGVSKKFCRSLKRSLWYGVQDVSNDLFGRKGQLDNLRKNEFWAVDDISFELKRGECLGLIGPNGAGKSTLLKILNGLIKPDKGRVTIRGRVGALIELGAGFNPILTARENIYVNGSVLGLTKKEIDLKFDEIVNFAEIDKFIDTPVQSFSSGMKVRLGFAVAAQMEPDVLLIDEVLAVGDAGFRAKCYSKISDISETAAVVFVSHNMQHIARLAPEALVMSNGQRSFYGEIAQAVNEYFGLFTMCPEERLGSGEARLTELQLNGRKDYLKVSYGEQAVFHSLLTAYEDINDLIINFAFQKLDDEAVAECSNYVLKTPINVKGGHNYLVEATIPEFILNPGAYQISILLASGDMLRHFDWRRHMARIEVVGGRPSTAAVQIKAEWKILNA